MCHSLYPQGIADIPILHKISISVWISIFRSKMFSIQGCLIFWHLVISCLYKKVLSSKSGFGIAFLWPLTRHSERKSKENNQLFENSLQSQNSWSKSWLTVIRVNNNARRGVFLWGECVCEAIWIWACLSIRTFLEKHV